MKKTVFDIEVVNCPNCKSPLRITKRVGDLKIGYCDKCKTEQKII